MPKNMYSLILDEKIVNMADALAYRQNTSRSNLINRILADYFSIQLPEHHIQDIFKSVETMTENHHTFQLQSQPRSSMMILKSILNYKYNPTIRYSVDIRVNDNMYNLEFKVVSRSQSESLLKHLNTFFHIWNEVEAKLFKENIQFRTSNGTYKRQMQFDTFDYNSYVYSIGDVVANYIKLFDEAINIYFDIQDFDIQEIEKIMNEIVNIYEKYLLEIGMNEDKIRKFE